MLVPNRHGSSNSYRYGFNGKEKDDEVKGEGVQYDYGFRIYDARIGKFLSTDPLTKSFPWYTPYQFAGNKPINSIDLDGLEEAIVILEKFDEQGNAVFSITRNDQVTNKSNDGSLQLIFKDKFGNEDSKLINKMRKYDLTLNRIVSGHETSALQSINKATYDYYLTISQEGIKETSAKVFNVDNGTIIDNKRTGFNSGDITFATTKLNIKVEFKMGANSEGTGGGGHITSGSYIQNALVPAFNAMDEKLLELNVSKETSLEINISVDDILYENKKEYNLIENFIKINYPNAVINRTGAGSGAHILLKDVGISKEEMEEYNNSKVPDDE